MKYWKTLSAGLALTLAALIFGLGVPHSSKMRQADTVGVAPFDDDWLIQSHPLSLRLKWIPDHENRDRRDRNAFIGTSAREIDRDLRPLSSIKLFGVSADWKYGGQIQYRFEGIRPLGGSVGGRIASNSLRLTLSWSGQK